MIPHLEVDGAFGSDAFRPRRETPRLVVVLEGPNDIAHLRRLSRILSRSDRMITNLDDLERSGTIAFVATGAASVSPIPAAVCGLGPPEVHLYDRETDATTRQRRRHVEAINRRTNCRAFLTHRRTLENYLHPHAIADARGLRVSFGPDDDVAAVVARSDLQLTAREWAQLSPRARRRLRCRAKQWLNRDAVDCMTVQRLAQSDPDGEITGWLCTIGEFLQ